MGPDLPSRRPAGPPLGVPTPVGAALTRAARSPVAVGGGVAAGGVAALAGLGFPGAIGGFILGWVVAVVVPALLRARPRGPGPDPFAVGEPWRRYVMAAVRHQRRFAEASRAAPHGPLRERLAALGGRVDAAVAEVWEIAQAGNRLSKARRSIGPAPAVDPLDGDPQDGDPLAIRDDADARLSAGIATTERRLAALDAQLGAVVTRAIEVTATAAGGADFGVIESDLTQLVDEMEALRLALGELDGDGPGPTRDGDT